MLPHVFPNSMNRKLALGINLKIENISHEDFFFLDGGLSLQLVLLSMAHCVPCSTLANCLKKNEMHSYRGHFRSEYTTTEHFTILEFHNPLSTFLNCIKFVNLRILTLYYYS